MDLSRLLQGMGPMQERMRQAEAERAKVVIVGRAGGGAVEVRITGGLELAGVAIAPAAATSIQADASLLEDLIGSAISDALRQFRSRFGTTGQEQMEKLMAGSDLGSLLGPLLGGSGTG